MQFIEGYNFTVLVVQTFDRIITILCWIIIDSTRV